MRTSSQWTRAQRRDDRWTEKGCCMPKGKNKDPKDVIIEQINKLDTNT